MGDPAAQTVLVVFSDFACPYCRAFARESLPKLQQTWLADGKVQLVFRHLPLSRLHPTATRAATAAECAARHDRFWQMHDRLFAGGPEAFGDDRLLKLAVDAGLSKEEYRECARAGLAAQLDAKVRNDSAAAASMGISSTPFFVLGRREPDGRVRLMKALGAMPYEGLAGAIRAAVSRAD
jgi:protein-disulfide isomerase